MMIGYYIVTLIYINLYGDKDADSKYGERVRSVSIKDFRFTPCISLRP